MYWEGVRLCVFARIALEKCNDSFRRGQALESSPSHWVPCERNGELEKRKDSPLRCIRDALRSYCVFAFFTTRPQSRRFVSCGGRTAHQHQPANLHRHRQTDGRPDSWFILRHDVIIVAKIEMTSSVHRGQHHFRTIA